VSNESVEGNLLYLTFSLGIIRILKVYSRVNLTKEARRPKKTPLEEKSYPLILFFSIRFILVKATGMDTGAKRQEGGAYPFYRWEYITLSIILNGY